MEGFVILFAVGVGILAFGAFGGWIASQKNRSIEEGVVLGAIFGPFGCLVEAVLPTKDKPPPASDWLSRSPWSPPTDEEIERAKLALQAHEARTEEARRQHEEEQRRAGERMRAEAARRDAEARARMEEADRWWNETIVHFGWFKALPDVLQPIVVAAAICVPLVAGLVLVMRDMVPPVPPAVDSAPERTQPAMALNPEQSPRPPAKPTVPLLERLAEASKALDAESRRIVGRFMRDTADAVIYLDADDARPSRLVIGGFLSRKSTGAIQKDGREALPYFIDPDVRKILEDNPGLYAMRMYELDDAATEEGPKADAWAEKLSTLSEHSKSLLRRFRDDGLESIVYLAPGDGPPGSLVEMGAVLRDPALPGFGEKLPYVLSQRAKAALRANPGLPGDAP